MTTLAPAGATWDEAEGVMWLPRRGERAPRRRAGPVPGQAAPARGPGGGTLARAAALCAVAAGIGTAAMASMPESRPGRETPAVLAMAVPMPAPRLAGLPGHDGPQEAGPSPVDAAVAAVASLSEPPSSPSAETLLPKGAALPSVSGEEIARIVAPAGPRDPDELLSFGPMRIRRWLVEAIVRAAGETGSDPVLLMAIADKESSFSTQVKAATSSAEGLFQFIDQTWLKVVRQYGARHGMAEEASAIVAGDDGFEVPDAKVRTRILERRRDPYLSALMASEMLRDDSARIARRIGRDLTHGEVYLAHFLGPDDAGDFLAKVVGAPRSVAAKLLPRPARANRPIFFAGRGRRAKGLSVAEVHRKFEAMIGMRTSRYSSLPQVAGALAYAGADAPATP